LLFYCQRTSFWCNVKTQPLAECRSVNLLSFALKNMYYYSQYFSLWIQSPCHKLDQ
jgi:hypothetical protein